QCQLLRRLRHPVGHEALPRGRLVRAEGLEPPRLSSPEPKSGASTSFATPAHYASRAPRPEPAPQQGAVYSTDVPGTRGKAGLRRAAASTWRGPGGLPQGGEGQRQEPDHDPRPASRARTRWRPPPAPRDG